MVFSTKFNEGNPWHGSIPYAVKEKHQLTDETLRIGEVAYWLISKIPAFSENM